MTCPVPNGHPASPPATAPNRYAGRSWPSIPSLRPARPARPSRAVLTGLTGHLGDRAGSQAGDFLTGAPSPDGWHGANR
jgi:hypothetical protein